MKIHTPTFIIGLLVFITPFLGLPSIFETIIIAAFGIAIMIITTNFNSIGEVASINKTSPNVSTPDQSAQS